MTLRTLCRYSFVALLIVLTGCEESDPEVFNDPAISLSSLKAAAKQIEEETKRLDRFDRLTLPLVVDEAKWELQPCEPTPPLKAINLSTAIPAKVDIRGLAVEPESGKALVTYRDERRDQPVRETGGAYCDLRSGRVISKFELPAFAAPYSIDPTGTYAILSRADGIRSERETLYIAHLDHDPVMLQRWRPLVHPSVVKPKSYVEDQEIMWASFVGADRIVTASKAGVLHIWNFPQRKRMGSFAGVDGMPSLTPDKKLVVFAAGDTLALLDPTDPAIVGYRRIGSPPKKPVVAVDPNGKRVAIGGKDEVMIVDLEDGGYFRMPVRHLSTDPGSDLVSDFAFIGPFLHDSRSLYDFDSPRAVWSIGREQWQTPQGDSYWAVLWRRGPQHGQRDLVLRSFKIPHQDIAKRISQVYRTSDVLALRAGDSVRIDVSGIPADHRTEIRKALQYELGKKGFFPADSAAVTVKAFVDSEKEFKCTYVKSKGIVPTFYTNDIPADKRIDVSYRGSHARLWITKHGRKLWSRNGIEEPPRWLNVGDVPEHGKLSFYAEPDYSIFTDPGLPDYIAGDYSDVLGSTTLFSDGIKSRTKEPKTRRRGR